MDKLFVLGTGNAAVKHCYNTCFALKKENEYLLVDAGGGNQILNHLEQMNISLSNIHHLFVSHEHTDHILGVVWLVRMIATKINSNDYVGNLHIYCHEELVNTIKTLCQLTLQKKLTAYFDNRIIFYPLKDGDQYTLLETSFTFFDILSTKAKQFGFTFINDDGNKIAFAGDEPYNEKCFDYIQGSSWLMHEAFCLYKERELFKPYEKHHSTTKDAAMLAESLKVKHLILWHTEEKNLKNRKELYTKEAKEYFSGEVFVPNDLEIINLM